MSKIRARPRNRKAAFSAASQQPIAIETNPADSAVKEINQAISGIICRAHIRDFYTAYNAKVKYLGRDLLAEAIQQEFAALPPEKQKQISSSSDKGKYGIKFLGTGPDVRLALCVVGCEISPNFKPEPKDLMLLGNPEQAQEITARFPDITAERIQSVIAAHLKKEVPFKPAYV